MGMSKLPVMSCKTPLGAAVLRCQSRRFLSIYANQIQSVFIENPYKSMCCVV